MQVELEAVEALMVVLPKNWRLCHSYPAPGGGDIDIVLTKKWLGVLALKKVAIEIKSWGGLYAKNGTLVKMSDGKPCYGNPAWQCYKNAKAIGAKPVLWLPVSKRSNAFEFSEYKIPSPILVVNGNASYLLKILG